MASVSGGGAVGGTAAGTIVGGPAILSRGSAAAGGSMGCCGGQSTIQTTNNGGYVSLPASAQVAFGGSAGSGSSTGCAGSCGHPVSCGAGEEYAGGQGSMAFVGPGGGEWVTETTYRYVGAGNGDITFVSEKRKTWCGLTLCILLAIGLIAALVFLFLSMPTTTTTVMGVPLAPRPEVRSCTFWGDPHLVTFDGARPSFYGDGDYWIIKNDQVHIQGRYMGTKYTYGLAATQKVVIGGPFLQGNTILIEPMEDNGEIRVNGESVCPHIGCTKIIGDNLATLTHDDKGDLIDEAASQFDRHMVHLTLPLGIKMTVFRWTNYLDLSITTSKLAGGQDGSCGNFNDDPSDDTTQAIFARVGARVDSVDCMFTDAPQLEFTLEEADMLNTCPVSKLDSAKLVCTEELKGTDPTAKLLKACMYDQCFGMNEHALRTAVKFATPEDRAAAGKMSSTA